MKVTNASSHSSLPPHLPLKVSHRRNFAASVGGLRGTMAYGNVDADEPIPLPVVPGTPKHNRNCWDKHNQGCICDLVSYWEVPWPYFPATARNMWEATAEEECPTEDSILSALPKKQRTVMLAARGSAHWGGTLLRNVWVQSITQAGNFLQVLQDRLYLRIKDIIIGLGSL